MGQEGIKKKSYYAKAPHKSFWLNLVKKRTKKRETILTPFFVCISRIKKKQSNFYDKMTFLLDAFHNITTVNIQIDLLIIIITQNVV